MGGKSSSSIGLLLAAGAGRRFGGAYEGAKLDQLIDGVSVGVRSFENLASVCDAMVVVVRHAQSKLALHARARGSRVVVNPTPERGMGYSIALGAKAVMANYQKANFLWGMMADMPFIEKQFLLSLAPENLSVNDDLHSAIVQPVFVAPANASARAHAQHGQPGHPVIFGRAHWDALTRLDGDTGAREIVAANREQLIRVETSDEGIWRDIDTPNDLVV